MTFLTTRRMLDTGIWVATALLVSAALTTPAIALHVTSEVSGWIMLGMLTALALLMLRKRLTPLPLGRVATWLDFHVYVGAVSVIGFFVHTGLDIPTGGLERTLALLYALVAATGFAGLYLSRTLPSRLTRRGEEVLFERIPEFTARLREQAEAVVVRSAREGHGTVLADFYQRRLAAFLAGPRHTIAHLLGSHRTCHALCAELRALDRYLAEDERPARRQLEAIVNKKDDLDFHYAGQGALKYWLFIHIPLTYGLLIFAVWHVVLVYAYSETL
ncbi:MAG: hypothetical protein ACE5E5_07460 [Phycisphaerae bacterium]